MKKNVASQVVGCQMVSASDGSAFTGSVTVSVTGDAGTQATGSVGSGACTHEGNGFHTYAPAQAETNYDHVAFTFTGTGAIPATVQIYTSFPQTGDGFARIGSNGAGLSAIPWNSSWDAEVESEVTDALNAYDPPTNAEMVARTLAAADYATATAVADLPTNAELATALGTADDAVLAQVALVKAETDKIADVLADTNELQTDWVNGGRLDLILDARASQTSVDDLPTNSELATALDALPTAAENADAVWDETIADHDDSGSTGEALAAAGAAGDPWITALPGSYTSGQAGYILGTNLNATVGSRATQTSVDDLPTNAELATALGTADDAVLTAIDALPTAAENADALLGRSIAGGANGGRMVKDALKALRNRVGIATGTMTVYEADDSTPAWTAAVTTTAGDPLSEIDPT